MFEGLPSMNYGLRYFYEWINYLLICVAVSLVHSISLIAYGFSCSCMVFQSLLILSLSKTVYFPSITSVWGLLTS